MFDKSEVVAAFDKRIEELEKEVGCKFEISYPKFKNSLEENRLYADWFEPGTILANAAKGNVVITYSITGDLDARLDSATGDPLHTFSGKFRPISENGVSIENDKDLQALSAGNHPSGCKLLFRSNNKLMISVNDKNVGPIIADVPSVAKGILNKEHLVELLNAAGGTDEEAPAADKDDVAPVRIDDIGVTYELGSDLPDITQIKPIERPNASLIADDIPEYDEYIAKKKEEEKAALEKAKEAIDESLKEKAEKPTKKPAKKTAAKEVKKETKKEKKTSSEKKTAATSNDVPEARFDLLPLDLIGILLAEFGSEAYDPDFFTEIEDYKKGERTLLDASISYAKANYSDGPEAVMALAEAFAKDAGINGEDAWKEGDTRTYLNAAIRDHLLHTRDKEATDLVAAVLGNLICAAWLEDNK